MGPPCTTFTFWYRFTSSKNTRMATCPEGLGLSDAERLGNEMASFCPKLANLCIQQGVWLTIEQPRASLTWALADFQNIVNHPSTRMCHLVMCQYGSPHEKKTSCLSNAAWIMGAVCKCSNHKSGNKTHTHTVLQGSVNDAVSGVAVHRTELAAAYPPALCDRLIQLATEAAS